MRVTTPWTVEVSTTYVLVGIDGLGVGLEPGVRPGPGMGLGRRLRLTPPPLEVDVPVTPVLAVVAAAPPPSAVVVARQKPALVQSQSNRQSCEDNRMK